MRTPALAVTTAVIASALILTGCSADRSEDAVTVDGPAVTSTATPEPEAEESEAPVVEAASLTQEQITAALLTQADMPAGWVQDPPGTEAETPVGGDDAEDTATYEPAACKDILNGLDEASSEVPAAEGKVSFSTADYAVFVQAIETWDKTFDQSNLDQLVAGLSACSNVTQTETDGTVTTSTITALDLPNYGDRTFAARIAAMTPIEGLGDLTFTIDFVTVATGTTSVSFVAGGFQPVDPAVLQGIISTAMTKVGSV